MAQGSLSKSCLMSSLSSTLLFMLVLLRGLTMAVPTIVNPPVLANVRIEGPSSTLFDGQVVTQGHNITTRSSNGTHHCDGTNGGASRIPGATCTTALADAVKGNFDATFFATLDDFFVTTILNVSQTNTTFWGLAYNYRFSDVGGCQQKLIYNTDQVLWAFGASTAEHFLFLSGPSTAKVNQSVTVTVVDGASNLPIPSASVGGKLTDRFGNVQLTFNTTGVQSLKATRADSIRSNTLNITVASAVVSELYLDNMPHKPSQKVIKGVLEV